jgi:hypothetical protein
MRASRWILAVPALLALAARAATADLPDPPMCIFDDRLGRSPQNVEVGDPAFQYVFNGVLRDGQGRPVAHYPAATVQLLIKTPCPNPVILHPDADSDAAGAVRWGAGTLDQGGGACAGPAIVEIRVLPVGLMKLPPGGSRTRADGLSPPRPRHLPAGVREPVEPAQGTWTSRTIALMTSSSSRHFRAP